MYYLQGQTMETIARHLQISRSSVSRLLAHAREVGLVRISVSASPGLKGTLAGQIADIFGIQVSVVPVHDVHTEVNRLHNVALVAAEHLTDMLFPGATVVQLNGAATATETEMPYAEAIITCAAKAIGGRIVNFPVPAFFDYADTKEALWRERSIQSVLTTIDNADVALFGVGSMSARLPSHVYSGGFLEPDEIAAAQNDGVVGDVCTVLIREDGSTDMHLNERASGPTPATLKKIPRRLCVVSGASKALPLLGALRAGVATDLVLDDGAAHELLDLVHPRAGHPRRRP